jgi:hypothetical protein
MSEGSRIGDGGKADQRARRERRLAAALRENLRRRKAQAKGRSAGQTLPERPTEPHDSAGIAADKHTPSPVEG